MMRVAIYSRFSSDMQSPRSITDQVAMARQHAERQGWTVADEYSDAAISGASMVNRPGLLALIEAATERRFDAVLTESLDRLSRNQADIAAIYERLAFRGVKVFTLADGEANEMHVGIKGLMSALFLKDLAQKTRRGQAGIVKEGRSANGKSYGYNLAPDKSGQLAINEAEAAVVRRIFDEYARGLGPRAIIKRLNTDGIPSPRGDGSWTISTLLGDRASGRGMLGNRLYHGELVYGRFRYLKDPETGKRRRKKAPPSEWVTHSVPHLRLVDEETWAKVQALRDDRAGTPKERKRSPKYLLSGLAKCVCGSNYVRRSVHRGVIWMVCSAHERRGGCPRGNSRFISAAELESRVLKGLAEVLLAPERIKSAVDIYRKEAARLAAARANARNTTERELVKVRKEIKNAVAAIREMGGSRALQRELAELEGRETALEAELASVKAHVVELHPRAADRYREIVSKLKDIAKIEGPEAAEAKTALRGLITEVRITPTPKGQPVRVEVFGDIRPLLQPETKARPATVDNAARVAVAV
jgi:DNA invertase Pin-like site-specific DNA recombinase